MSTTQQFISIPAAGKKLGLSARTIQRLIDQGVFDAITIPGCHARVSLAQVESYIPATLRTCPTCGKPGYSGYSSQPSPEQGPKPRGRPFQKGTSGNPLGRPPKAAPVASRRKRCF